MIDIDSSSTLNFCQLDRGSMLLTIPNDKREDLSKSQNQTGKQ